MEVIKHYESRNIKGISKINSINSLKKSYNNLGKNRGIKYGKVIIII
jgi:hypothetical protein